MTQDEILEFVIYKLRNATINSYPFPHFYVADVFPSEIYNEIYTYITQYNDFTDSDTYKNRKLGNSKGFETISFMKSKHFLRNVLSIFKLEFQQYLEDEDMKNAHVSVDIRIVRDGKGYKIGPHTDAIWKLVSLLFYIPNEKAEFSQLNYGTSIYVPKDHNFVCKGGPHYPFEPFTKIYTAPYARNSCFGFWKTPNSFHGVEPIDVEIERNVILYNIYGRGSGDEPDNQNNGT